MKIDPIPFAAANAARPDLPPWPTGGEPLDVAHAKIERRFLAHVAELEASRERLEAQSRELAALSSELRAEIAALKPAPAPAPRPIPVTIPVTIPVEPTPHPHRLSNLIATLFLVAMLFFGIVGFLATWGRP